MIVDEEKNQTEVFDSPNLLSSNTPFSFFKQSDKKMFSNWLEQNVLIQHQNGTIVKKAINV